MRLAKLLGEAEHHEEGITILKKLLSEGAGVYEDEAQNLCAGYYAITGKPEEAGVMFNVLKNRSRSPLAEEAAYKVAIVWMKAGQTDLAQQAVEDFAARYAGNPRTVELYIRLARHLYDNKRFKSAVAMSTQVQDQYAERPEAAEAAYIIALCFRETADTERAIQALDKLGATAQRVHNNLLASEAWFELARILHEQQKKIDASMDYYRRAVEVSRGGLSVRQQQILEHSLYHLAEYEYRAERWSAALDLYIQLRETGSRINVLARILNCRSRMDEKGLASLSADTEDELRFLKDRIAANAGSILALQAEVYILDARLERHEVGPGPSPMQIAPLIEEYHRLLKEYATDVLALNDMRAYIRMRIGYASTLLSVINIDAKQAEALLRDGLAQYEQALRESPESLFKIEIMEGVAILAARVGESQKAFKAYQTLYKLTGDHETAPRTDRTRKRAHEYLTGMASMADTASLVQDAIVMLYEIILDGPEQDPDVREAQFHIGDMLYVKKQYSEAAREYKLYISRYGPPMDIDGNVETSWKAPVHLTPVLERGYEAGIRIAHCWFAQGHKKKMLQAYGWVVRNQDHLNPRVAEALYYTLSKKPQDSAQAKADVATALWTRIVNPSTDFGSKGFGKSYKRWLYHSRAVPYVKRSILRSGELYSTVGNHMRAAEVFRQYVEIYSLDKKDPKNTRPIYERDEQYEVAEYALGRELIQTGDYETMVQIYHPYIDGLRNARFRSSILMLMGHYGTEGEHYEVARSAYAALMDEYGAPNPTDEKGEPIPVPPAERLNAGSRWNGVRRTPPEIWDPGKIRYALAYLYWKQGNWASCRLTLTPFTQDARLHAHEATPKALLMLARANIEMKDDGMATPVLERLIARHPRFTAIQEAYVDLAAAAYRTSNWKVLENCYAQFVKLQPDAQRRPYMDFYRTLSMIAKGDTETGITRLRDLADAETYQDLKADAHYHLALQSLAASAPDHLEALKHLRESIDYFPRAKPMLEAGRLAVTLKRWKDARTYLDRCIREFPQSEMPVLEEARKLLAQVAEAEAADQ
jgi:tetratricopeptide (TPR) repeat protein